MKVTRGEPKFEPVIITLETQEEMDYMWHKLNAGTSFSGYCEEKDISFPWRLSGDMWSDYDDVYTPEGEE